jgi:hypothetical protein
MTDACESITARGVEAGQVPFLTPLSSLHDAALVCGERKPRHTEHTMTMMKVMFVTGILLNFAFPVRSNPVVFSREKS